jgi:hypothetical protein
VYNYLQVYIPKETETLRKLGRNAVIGFSASVVSGIVYDYTIYLPNQSLLATLPLHIA